MKFDLHVRTTPSSDIPADLEIDPKDRDGLVVWLDVEGERRAVHFPHPPGGWNDQSQGRAVMAATPKLLQEYHRIILGPAAPS